MLIKLVLGDSSGDGHEQTAEYNYESNMSAYEIQQAHAEGVKKLVEQHGIWIDKALKDLCTEYEDNKISPQLKDALQKSGIKLGYDACEGYMEEDSFANLYIQVAMIGRPDLVMIALRMEDINIGGYGLFYG